MEKLSQEKLQEIFDTNIYPELVAGKDKETEKEAAIIGGQPGSGKSSTVHLLLQKKENLVFINGDDFREFLPGYYETMMEDPDNAADVSQYAVNYWVEKSIERCAQEGFSIIVEGTMRVPETSLKTAIALKNFGYLITFVLVSTPYELSLESVRSRYEETVKNHGVGRSTKIESHDQAFRGIKETILALFNAKIADRFIVINRTQTADFEWNEFVPEEEIRILEQFNKNRGDIPIQNAEISNETSNVKQDENKPA